MKVGIDCASCLFHRGYMEILEATKDPSLRFEATRFLFNLLAENFKPTAIPSDLGTMRDRLIKRITGNSDPYAEKKHMSNQKALEIIPLADKIISAESRVEGRFRKSCLCAITGNIIEFDIPGHNFDFNDLKRLVYEAEKDLVIDDILEAYKLACEASLILYLTDNAGEIAFDTLFVRELRGTGARVIVAVKDRPISNDATLEDARYVGMEKVVDSLITIGTDTMGLSLSGCSDEFLKYYKSAEMVVAKGMGYAETITEININSPHFLLLRTKCMNVANFFGVERYKNIAKLLYPDK